VIPVFILPGVEMQRFLHMLGVVWRADGQQPSARTVEVFGWIVLAEGMLALFAPVFVANVLRLPELSVQSANYVRLVGLLLGGIGMLYVISGRTNAQGFVFASLLDRPLVPIVMAVVWLLGLIPGQLALLFGLSDSLSFLWTLRAWVKESAVPVNVAAANPAVE
jgi:hypothetical protein